jgi:hypothetical protein
LEYVNTAFLLLSYYCGRKFNENKKVDNSGFEGLGLFKITLTGEQHGEEDQDRCRVVVREFCIGPLPDERLQANAESRGPDQDGGKDRRG